MSHAVTRMLRLILLLIAAAPILLTYAILLRQSTPIPLLDDYPSLLGFAEHFQQLPSNFSKLLYIAAAQHGEYKLLLVHTIVALELITLHHLNLSLLIALGNLAPLLILAVLWRNSFPDEQDLSRRLLLFLPVPFLLFQLNYAEALDWAMPTLQNLGVIAFALLAIHFLLRPGRASILGAIAAATLACSASAGGLLLAPVGALLFLSQRKVRATLVWAIPFCVMLLLYLYRYIPVPRSPPAGPIGILLFFLSFLGSAYENMHHRPVPYLSILLGVALCCGFIAVLRRRKRSHPSFRLLSTTFILATAALATMGRAGLGLQASLSVRYKIYSDLLLILAYLTLAQRARLSSQRTQTPARQAYRFAVAATVLSLCLCAASDVVGYKFLSKRRSQLIQGLQQYNASPATTTPMLNPNATETPEFANLQEQARVTLTRALELGLYRPPRVP